MRESVHVNKGAWIVDGNNERDRKKIEMIRKCGLDVQNGFKSFCSLMKRRSQCKENTIVAFEVTISLWPAPNESVHCSVLYCNVLYCTLVLSCTELN